MAPPTDGREPMHQSPQDAARTSPGADPAAQDGAGADDRRRIMATLATADATRLGELAATLPMPTGHDLIRPAETGLIMARGRMGGTGSPFNLGEVTVTRCVVRVKSGEVGTAYVLGRDKTHARTAALIDALWQNPVHRPVVEACVITPLAEARDQARNTLRQETAATRVDFFTMVRGDN